MYDKMILFTRNNKGMGNNNKDMDNSMDTHMGKGNSNKFRQLQATPVRI